MNKGLIIWTIISMHPPIWSSLTLFNCAAASEYRHFRFWFFFQLKPPTDRIGHEGLFETPRESINIKPKSKSKEQRRRNVRAWNCIKYRFNAGRRELLSFGPIKFFINNNSYLALWRHICSRSLARFCWRISHRESWWWWWWWW